MTTQALNAALPAGLAGRLPGFDRNALRALLLVLAGMLLFQASSCGGGGFGTSTPFEPAARPNVTGGQPLPPARGEVLGSGQVRVGLLLPLSGDPSLAEVGGSLRNAAQLTVEALERSGSVPNNIHLVIKDTQGNPTIARNMAAEAINEGADLVLGPLRAEEVRSAGGVARASGVPLIGFSNNSGAASDGIYLLNVLPESEALRAIGYAQNQGRRSFAVIASRGAAGQVHLAAFRAAAAQRNANVTAIYQFSPDNEEDFRSVIMQITPLLQAGTIDAVYLPERLYAPNAAVLLEAAQVDKTRFSIIGSADWDGDVKIIQTAYLDGALFPAVDPQGYAKLSEAYVARFGNPPHRLTSLVSTAIKLANHTALVNANPRYAKGQLTDARGFLGDDGGVRFLANGTNQHQLVMKRVSIGRADVVDGLKYPQ